MQQRRLGGQRLPRGASSPAANGHHSNRGEGQLCPGGAACISMTGGGEYRCGCISRKSSPLRRTITSLRVYLGQVVGARRSNKGLNKVVAGAYLAACIFVVWFGLQVSALLRGSKGGAGVVRQQEQRPPHRRELAKHAARLGGEGGASGVVPGYGEDDDGPRLAYGIMVYQRAGYSPQKTLDQWARMFNALYDEDNTYVIHVDIKSDKALLEAISYHISDLPNVYEVPSVSVSWAGITVVERTLALMTKAVEVDSTWRYFVNLGHEDYPSISQTAMRRWLKDKPDGTNFIKCWPIEGHDFFGQWEHHDQRLQDVHVDDFMGGVREYRSMSGRPGSQERPKSGYRFFKSLQQTTLSRQLTEYAIYSSEARRLLLYMATAKAPDELYFPTLTQLDERYSSMATCDDTRHFSYWIRPGGSWHPEYLTLDHLPIVLNATEFFIRKVEEARGSAALLDTLDLLRAGHSLEKALPIMRAWLNRKEPDGITLQAEGGPIMEFPADGTVEEAMWELARRQAEWAECRRAMFLAAVHRHNRNRSEAWKEAAALAAVSAEAKRRESKEHKGGKWQKKPFGKDPLAIHKKGDAEFVSVPEADEAKS